MGTVLRKMWLRPAMVLGGLLVFSLSVFVASLWVPRVDGALIGSDGVGYYAILRSVVIDHDLDFTNEFAYYRWVRPEIPLRPDGRPANHFSVGTALLWLPFFLVAHALALAGSALGLAVRPDGLGFLYQGAASVGSICYGAAGFALIHRSASRLFGNAAALASVAALWLASNSIYYMVVEPSMAHMVGLFSVAALYTYWHQRIWQRAPVLRDGVLLGLLGGLVLLVRLQDATLLLAPYGYLLWGALAGQTPLTPAPRRAWLTVGIATAAGTVIAFLPQLLAWRLSYGTWLAWPYLHERTPSFYWLQPQFAGVLVLPGRGMFVWHPVYALAALGLVLLARRQRALTALLGASFVMSVYVVAAWWGWDQGDSFGGRMFVSGMWTWGVGLAALIAALPARPKIVSLAWATGVILIGWNALSLLQYRLILLWQPGLPNWRDITVERLTLLWHLLGRL